MTDPSKIKATHTQRAAFVYLRQSTPSQVEHNRESTARQYALADKACKLGWSKEQVVIMDEDLGLSGSSTDKRSGFTRMTSEVALAHVGIILGLEVSRLARNNADWYRLLDLCGITDTLIGDNDGVYHPALFKDRLLLGLKGTMSEAELHILRARLDGGIRNKAARGELRRGLPVGFVWGEQDGEVLFHPDEAVTGAIRTVFERFAEFGSARRVWLWFRSEGLLFPLQYAPSGQPGPIRWVTPTYTALHHILTNPVYAGAYAYGKSRSERYVDEHGAVKKRMRHLPIDQWAVLIPEHHAGFIDWATFQANQARLDSNTRPQPHQSGGAVREGSALLQGMATCATAAGDCTLTIAVETRLPATTAPAKIWSMAAACTASTSAVWRSSRPWPMPCSKLSHRPPWKPCGSLSNNSKPTTTRLCRTGVWKWNVHGTKPNGPNAATEPRATSLFSGSTVWRRNGRAGFAIWRGPKPNCAAGSNSGPARLTRSNSNTFRCSAPIFDRDQHHRP